MGTRANKLVKGSMLRVFEFFVNAIVGILLMPFIIHSLGDKMYGLWIFVGSFLGFYGLMDFGLHSAVQRYISRAAGKQDHDEINKVINTSLFIFLMIGIIALIASFGIAYIVPQFIKKIEDIDTFRKVILILGFNCALGFPLRVFSGVLLAHIRFDLRTFVELIKIILRTVLIVIFLKRGHGIIALALITFFMDITGYCAIYFLVRKLYKFIIISKKLIDSAKIKSLFSYSIYTYIAQIAEQLRLNIDNFVIVAYLGFSYLTLYSIGARLIKYFMEFIGSGVGMTMPLFSQLEGKGDYSEIKDKFIFLTKISSYLSMLIGGSLFIFGRPFIIRWMGVEYENAYVVLIILLVPSVFETMQTSSKELLYGLSKHKYYTVANIAEGVATVILSIIFVKKYGIYGVALGSAFPRLIFKVFIQPVYTCKAVGMRLGDFYLKVIAPTIVLSTFILAFVWFFLKSFIVAQYYVIFVCAGCLVSVFLVITYVLGFKEKEKRYFLSSFVK